MKGITRGQLYSFHMTTLLFMDLSYDDSIHFILLIAAYHNEGIYQSHSHSLRVLICFYNEPAQYDCVIWRHGAVWALPCLAKRQPCLLGQDATLDLWIPSITLIGFQLLNQNGFAIYPRVCSVKMHPSFSCFDQYFLSLQKITCTGWNSERWTKKEAKKGGAGGVC